MKKFILAMRKSEPLKSIPWFGLSAFDCFVGVSKLISKQVGESVCLLLVSICLGMVGVVILIASRRK